MCGLRRRREGVEKFFGGDRGRIARLVAEDSREIGAGQFGLAVGNEKFGHGEQVMGP